VSSPIHGRIASRVSSTIRDRIAPRALSKPTTRSRRSPRYSSICSTATAARPSSSAGRASVTTLSSPAVVSRWERHRRHLGIAWQAPSCVSRRCRDVDSEVSRRKGTRFTKVRALAACGGNVTRESRRGRNNLDFRAARRYPSTKLSTTSSLPLFLILTILHRSEWKSRTVSISSWAAPCKIHHTSRG